MGVKSHPTKKNFIANGYKWLLPQGSGIRKVNRNQTADPFTPEGSNRLREFWNVVIVKVR
jgi:hypothetical protein